jgi:hypothetical protein
LDFLPAFVVAVSLGLLVRRKWLPVVILNAALLLAYAANPLTSNFISTPFGTVPYLWMHILAFIVLLSPLGRKAGQWVKDVKTAPKIQRTKKYIATLAGGLIAVVMGFVLLLLALSMPEPFITSALKTVYAAVGIAIVILAVSFMVIKLKVTKLTIGFTVLAFIGTMMQHLMGGILFEVVSGQIAGTIPLASYPGIWTAVFYVYPWERLALIIGAVVVGVPVTRALGKFIFPTEPKPVSNPSADQSIPK